MPIKAEAAVTEKAYKDMWRYSFFRKRSGVGMIIFICFLSFIYLVSFFMRSDKTEAIPGLITGLLILAVLLFCIFIQPRLLYQKSVAEMAKKTNYYTFEKDFFTIRSEQDGEEGFSKIKYSSLYQIHETKDYFYIYISYQQTHIIIKEHIENASPEQLRQLLQGNMPKNKYKRFGV